MEIKCYRAQPEQSDNALRYFMHTLSRKGAMACYDIAEQWLTATQDDPAQHADWQIAKALVLGRVRDFSQAQQLLDDASQQPNAADWAARIRLRLWEDEGRWEAALDGAKARYAATQCQMALEMVIRLTQAQEGPQAALTELLLHLPQSQNMTLWQEAAKLHFLLHQTEAALACLHELESLQVLGQDKDDNYADWLCGQLYLETRDLPAARAALGRQKDTFSTLVLKRLQPVTTLSPVLKLAVPHVTQKYMTCAPSSIAAVVRYWGEPADEDAIAEQICFQGTADHLQRQWLTDNGWSYVDFDLSLAAAEAVLSRGIPFTLVTTQGMSSHLQVVKGIDREAGYLYLMDPSVNMESKILTEETCQLEAVHGPRCRAIVPNSKQHLFAGLDLPAQDLYPLRHALDSALDKQDIPQARSLITQLEALAPDHRITQLSHRSLAVVLRDEADIERYTTQLLAAYPDTTYLILSKYHSMRARCGHREAYLWLSAQFKQAKSIEVFNLLLEDRAVLEDGNAAIEALADRAVMWTNAEYFWLKGHDSWRDGDKETAVRLYGWALYLEPSNDAYLRSYYIANVDQGRVEEALAQLQALYDASIAVSSSMAYSLYRAYCMKDEDHLA
ncbi:TPR-repeat-containing protein [Photobacterium aphoticum]|uniref:TPR-repeat-containing protein n=1 Tax=Photobacterium aphoticum TaxID=754436 RepID=A0A090QQW9_9GAMM|nr:TPR-repeat-containing protein [Photobacterium aphoticum]